MDQPSGYGAVLHPFEHSGDAYMFPAFTPWSQPTLVCRQQHITPHHVGRASVVVVSTASVMCTRIAICAVGTGSTQLLAKSNIHEAELTFDPAVQAAAPLVAQLNADKSLATLLSLFIPQLRLESAAIKLQYNEGWSWSSRQGIVYTGCGQSCIPPIVRFWLKDKVKVKLDLRQ
jgi:hypothetical protein